MSIITTRKIKIRDRQNSYLKLAFSVSKLVRDKSRDKTKLIAEFAITDFLEIEFHASVFK